MLHQVFDPLGFTIPYIILGRRILQLAFARSHSNDWDSPIPEDLRRQWLGWLNDLGKLEEISIPRCYHIEGEVPERYEVHTFSDASNVGLGAASYLRFFKDNSWSVVFLRGKGRLIPLNADWSVARFELQAAVLAAQLHKDVMNALDVKINRAMLWTDSASVLAWITNQERRPKVFVYNRKREILRLTNATQWSYVHTSMNPADLATRGISPKKASCDSMWLVGPPFLYNRDEEWPTWNVIQPDPSNLELVPETSITAVLQTLCCIEEETEVINTTYTSQQPLLQDRLMGLLWKFSKFDKLIRVFAWLRRLSIRNKPDTLSIAEIDAARLTVIQLAQQEYFSAQVILNIKKKGFQYALDKCANKDLHHKLVDLCKLTPFVDEANILRVGGRLQNSPLPPEMIHPIVLPKRHHVTRLLIEEVHNIHRHFGGPNYVFSNLVSKYWVTSSTIKFYLDRCLPCLHIQAKTQNQIMAPLPATRVSVGKRPFEASGVDYFGPVLVKVKRSMVKRWIALFTCLSTRAVHLEVVFTLKTSSFLKAFFRFRNTRCNAVKVLHSDNATTFHGADNELKEALKKLESEGFKERLQVQGVDWVFNPPLASHQGGAWERLIRSVRKVLLAIPALQQTTPCDESLLTYLKEAEAVINNRPLTKTSGDPHDLPAITPAMILNGSLSPAAPVDRFHTSDQINDDWRYTQIAADQFWYRFVKEYLITLQPRRKWLQTSPNMKINDIVLVKDERHNYRPNYPKA